ncbi:MAG: hypothetical protein U0359_05080 [Byssovorax sp.]
MASSPARALLPLSAALLLTACSEPTPREVTPWTKSFATNGSASMMGMAVDGFTGGVALTGVYSGTIDFGAGPQKSAASSDLFLVEVDETGSPLWGGHTGIAGYQGQAGLGVAPNGDVLTAGTFVNAVGFGGPPLKATGQSTYLARVDPSGARLWDMVLGSVSGSVTCSSLAVDHQGNVIVTGGLVGEATIGGAKLASPGQAVFVAKYDSAGKPIFGEVFSGSGHTAYAIGVDAFDDIVIFGRNSGDLYFGDQSFFASNNVDGFVAKLDSEGKPLWIQIVTDEGGYIQPLGLAVGAAGEVAITGTYYAQIRLGGETITGNQNTSMFVARLSTSGEPLWLRGTTSTNYGTVEPSSIALGAGGAIYLTGDYSGSADLGTGELPYPQSRSAFLAELDSDGTTRTVKTFDTSTTSFSSGAAVAWDPAGGLLVSGSFFGDLSINGTSLHNATGGRSLFLSRFTTPL